MNKSKSIGTAVSALDPTILLPFEQKQFFCLTPNMVSSTSITYSRQVFHLDFTSVMISCSTQCVEL